MVGCVGDNFLGQLRKDNLRQANVYLNPAPALLLPPSLLFLRAD